jgi:hypothetical protein
LEKVKPTLALGWGLLIQGAVWIALSLFGYSSVWGQRARPDSIQSEFPIDVFAGISRAHFEFSIPAPTELPTIEFKFGINYNLQLPFVTNTGASLGASFGIRMRRSPYIQGYIPIPSLNEAVSSRHHFFMDFPVVIQVNPARSVIGLRSGLNLRQWMPDNGDVDILTARRELGAVLGINLKLWEGTSIGIDGCFGLTPLWDGFVAAPTWNGTFWVFSGPPIRVKTYSRFYQLSLQHCIFKNNKGQ